MDETADLAAFRAEVRDFALTSCPPEIRAAVAANRKIGRKEWSAWQRVLHARGWGAPSWPKEHGGTGWGWRRRHAFDEVTAECDCPPQYHHGLRHIGPVLIAFGTPEQKARFLPGILTGEEWWCQGYSEPGAGSDLASLKTRAERDGDEYVVDGQKLWTSHAHESDWMYTLVRTSNEAKRQDGITMLLIPLASPDVAVRSVHTIDGWHHVNEVFLDGVRVPVANRVGEEGKGWTYGKYLLDRERLGGANVAPAFRFLERARALLDAELPGPQHRLKREALELRLLQAESELRGVRELGLKAVDDAMNDRPLGVSPSVLKLATSEAMQRISQVALDAAGNRLAARFRPVDGSGPNAAVPDIEWAQNYMYLRAKTIFGGSSEVQKNVIARSLFGA